MIIGVPKELMEGENRVAAIPATVKEYIKKGMDVYIESGAGAGSFISDGGVLKVLDCHKKSTLIPALLNPSNTIGKTKFQAVDTGLGKFSVVVANT